MIREGKLNAKGFRFAIVVSRFNSFITERLLEGALDALKRHGAEEKQIEIYKVPGAFEIPLVAKLLAKKKDIDAVICSRYCYQRGNTAFRLCSIGGIKGDSPVIP